MKWLLSCIYLSLSASICEQISESLSMRRATSVLHHWPTDQQVSTVTLAFGDRHRRRIVLADDGGAEFLLDLPTATQLSDGDGLALEGGGVIAVRAAEEQVVDVTCVTAEDLGRIAWHVGNRHMPAQVLPGALRVPADHVLIEMLRGLGATVTPRLAPFQPEGGAYAGRHAHDH